MKLDLSQIQAITTGAVRITQQMDGFHFFRFTEEQERMFLPRNEKYYKKTFSTPGIRLRFLTNSETLKLKILASHGSPRSFFAVDISVNGLFTDGIDNYTGTAPAENYGDLDYPYGEFEKTVILGAGEKEVCIYLPWSVKTVLKELSLEDGASLIPAIPEKKALCFGDSITHGSDALRPSSRYISRLCDYLGAAEYNKAICGETFWPELAATKEPFEPDYITVAYGTNDWSHCPLAELTENCRTFYKNLQTNYPNARLIAITPIWRGDQNKKNREIPLIQVHDIICDAVKDNPNAVVLRGYDAVPHDPAYFGDLHLHPNDDGFACYGKSLIKQLEER